MFADESLQKYFDGAYVLVPQAPTFWMHGFKHFGDGTSIYEKTLMGLIKFYIEKHSNIDKSRIYVGGDSNGGYMTMILLRDFPDFFAAGFPVCGFFPGQEDFAERKPRFLVDHGVENQTFFCPARSGDYRHSQQQLFYVRRLCPVRDTGLVL